MRHEPGGVEKEPLMMASLRSRIGAPFSDRPSHLGKALRHSTGRPSAAQRAVVGFVSLVLAIGVWPPVLLAAQPAPRATPAAAAPWTPSAASPTAPEAGAGAKVQPAGSAPSVDARNDIVTARALTPTPIDVLANDLPGGASAARPLTISSVTQGARGRVTTDGTTVVYDPTLCSTGSDLFSYTMTDGRTTDTASVAVNIARPATTPLTDTPTAQFAVGASISSKIPLRLNWCGISSSKTAVRNYRVLQSTNAGSSFPKTIASTTTARSITLPLAPNASYAWKVRTTDRLGHVSSYAMSLASRISLYQDTSAAIVYSIGWKVATGSGYSGSKEHYTTTAGATATMTVTNVRAVAIVASKASTRGSLRLYVDGVLAATVSQRSSATVWRRILVARALTSGAGVTHQIQVQALGNGRIDLDAILTLPGQKDPVLAFTSTAPVSAHPGDTYAVGATSTSGYPVQLSIDPTAWGVCSIRAKLVTFVTGGTCVVRAASAGDPTWNPVATQQNIGVNHVTQTITFGALADMTYGAPAFDVSGTASSGLGVSFASLTAVVCTVASSTVSITGAGTCTVEATQAGNGVYAAAAPVDRSFAVAQRTLTVTGITADSRAFDGTTTAVVHTDAAVLHGVVGSDDAALSTASAIGTFGTPDVGTGKTVTISGLIITGTSAPSYALVAPTTTADISIGAQSIHFTTDAPTDAVVGGPAYPPHATATSGLPVLIAVNSAASSVCEISGDDVIFLSAGQCVLDADQAGDVSWSPAPQVQQSFTVAGTGSTPQTVDFPALPDVTYGVAPFGVTAAATSSLPVAFSSITSAVCTLSGSTVTVKAIGQCTVRAVQAGDATYAEAQTDRNFTVSAATLTVTASSPADGVYGDPVPSITPGYSGWAYSDGPSVLTAAPVCSTAYTPGAAPGDFTTSCTGAAADNYTVAPVAGAFHVGTKALTVDFTASPRAYNGGTAATIASCALTGRVGADDVACDASGATASFASPDAAPGITVTGSGFALAGTTADRYTIGTVNTTTADITKASQTVAFDHATPTGPLAGATWDASATATSGLAAAITIDATSGVGVCSLDADAHTVHLLAAGTCVVDADQGGDANHSAATRAQASFAVLSSGAHHLAFTVEPVSTTGGATMADITVEVRNVADGVLSSDTSSITLAIGTNPSGGALSGTATVAAVNGVATFTGLSVNRAGSGYTLHATDGSLVAADSTAFDIAVGATATVGVETVANGSGSTMPAQGVTSGASVTAYAVARDAGGNYAGNPSVTWSLTSATGGVAGTDLVGSTDSSHGTSATFTGHLLGSAKLHATDGTHAGDSGTITVSAGGAATLGVETAANGSGSIVLTQDVASGASIAAYAVTRDASGNFVGNLAATWSLTAETGTVANGDLVPSGDAKSALLTGNLVGSAKIHATDGSRSGDSGTITVVPGAAARLLIVSGPTSATAGVAISPAVTVAVEDAAGNRITSDASDVTVAIGANPGSGALSGAATVAASSGLATFADLSIDKAGTGYTLLATDGGLATATSGAFNIAPAAAATLVVTAPGAAPAGVPFTLAVTAKDAFGNTATGYLGSVHFTTTDGGAFTLPADSPFLVGDHGTKTFTNGATLVTTGAQTVTATDTVASAITGTSGAITIGPVAASHLVVSGYPTTTTAGGSHTLTVTAKDQYGNTAASYSGTVHLTTSDLGAGVSLSPDATLTGGVGTFNATLVTVGTQSITATDTIAGSITGTQSGITVTPAGASQLTVSGYPSPTLSGVSHPFTVTAKDAFGNTATGYAGTVHFSSTDGSATLPANAALTNGAGTFSGTLATGGTQSITATDTVSSSVTGSQSGIAVQAPDHLTFVAQPTTTVAGTVITTITVEMVDDSDALVTLFTGDVHVAIGTNPGGGTLSGSTSHSAVAGIATFPGLSIDKTGSGYRLGASATGISGDASDPFNITASSPDHLAITVQPASAVAGASIGMTVEIRDLYGNKVGTATNTVSVAITTNPGGGVLSGTASHAALAGVATFSGLAIDKTGTGYRLTASALNLTPAISVTFDIAPGAEASVTIESAADGTGAAVTTATVPAGDGLTIYAIARDAHGNLVGNPPATWSLTDKTGGVADGDLVAAGDDRSATFTGALVGSATIAADDSSFSDTTGTITVTVGAPDHLAFTSTPADAGYGGALSPLVVEVRDVAGNLITSAAPDVTVAKSAGPIGGSISGTTTVAAVGGVAHLTDVWADAAGPGYQLTASSGALGTDTTPAFSVAKVATSITFSAADKVYDGGTAAGSAVTCVVVGAVRGDILTCDTSAAVLTFASKDAATGITVNATGFALSGANKANYDLGAQPSTTADITAAGSTVTVQAPDATFDGSPHGATALWASTGTDGEGAALAPISYAGRNGTSYGPTATPPTNAGDYTASATFGGDTDHSGASNAADFSIGLAASATVVSCGSGPFTYTGAAQTPCSVSVTRVGASTLTPAPDYLSNTHAGLATASSTYPGDANHTGSSDTNHFTIDKADQVVAFTSSAPGGAFAGGAPYSPTTSGGASGNAVVISVDAGSASVCQFDGTDVDFVGAGTCVILADQAGSADYIAGHDEQSFAVGPAVPSHLGFSVEPSSSTGGVALEDISVSVLDTMGAVVTTDTRDVTIAILANPSSGTLSGTATVAAVAGVATFHGLAIDKAGTGYTLHATASGLTVATSVSFDITVGPATRLAFGQQPTSTTAATTISPAVTIRVEDAGGNLVTTDTRSITLDLDLVRGVDLLGELSGTLTKSAVGGAATFDDLSVNSAGEGYTLDANDGSLPEAPSDPFNVAIGAAAQMSIETAADGSGVPVGGHGLAADVPLTVYAITRDAGGNFVANVPATWSLINKTGEVADGDLVAAGDSKSATLTGHVAGTAAIHAVSDPYNASTGTIEISPGTPTHLAITQINPASPRENVAFSVTVYAKEADGDPAAVTVDTTVTITVASGPSDLQGTRTGIIHAGSDYVVITGIKSGAHGTIVLRASDTSPGTLTHGDSASFVIRA